MYEQLKNYFNKILSKYQYRFKKGLLGMEVVVVEGGEGGRLFQLLVWLTSLKRLIVCHMTYQLLSHMLTVSKKKRVFEFVVFLS